MAPPTLLTSLERASFDGVIEAAGDSTPAPNRIVWQDLAPSHEPLQAISPSAALTLYTSGSTGVPKEAGRRLVDIETELGLTGRHIDEFSDAVVKDAGEVTVRLVRDADRDLTRELDAARTSEAVAATAEKDDLTETDDELAHFLSTLRLTKDEWEVEEMRKAVAGSQNSPVATPTSSSPTPATARKSAA